MKNQGRNYAFAASAEIDEGIMQYSERLNLSRAEACRALIQIGLSIRPHEGALLAASIAGANTSRVWVLQQLHLFLHNLMQTMEQSMAGQVSLKPFNRFEMKNGS